MTKTKQVPDFRIEYPFAYFQDGRPPQYIGKSPPGLMKLPAPRLAPDRCFLVKVEAPKSSSPFAEVSFSFNAPKRQKGVKVSSEWAASPEATPSTGFLDLPKEIRNMIYENICGDMKRKGLIWAATSPHTPRQPGDDHESKNAQSRIKAVPSDDSSDSEGMDDPVMFADCAIMRTCRQLHAEFASILYASPLQLSGISQGNNILPFSSAYSHLVRQVLSVETRFSGFKEVHVWRQKLQIAASLSKVFPQAQVIRLTWSVDYGNRALPTITDAETWKTTVEEIQGIIKTVRKLSQVSSVIPWNLETVLLRALGRRCWRALGDYEEVEIIETPVTEAIAGLRAKKPIKRVGGGKKA